VLGGSYLFTYVTVAGGRSTLFKGWT